MTHSHIVKAKQGWDRPRSRSTSPPDSEPCRMTSECGPGVKTLKVNMDVDFQTFNESETLKIELRNWNYQEDFGPSTHQQACRKCKHGNGKRTHFWALHCLYICLAIRVLCVISFIKVLSKFYPSSSCHATFPSSPLFSAVLRADFDRGLILMLCTSSPLKESGIFCKSNGLGTMGWRLKTSVVKGWVGYGWKPRLMYQICIKYVSNMY